MAEVSGADRAKKTRGDESLGSALKQFLQHSGLNAFIEHPSIAMAWNRILDAETAGHTHIASFKRGTLEVAVDSSALMNEMEFMRANLLERMRVEIRKPFINRLVFVLKAAQNSNEQIE